MSTARNGACAVVLDGAIYVMGGEGADGIRLSSVEIFRHGRWQAGPPMSAARGYACAEVLDGAIYVMGGYAAAPRFSAGRTLDTVEVLRDGAWQPGPPMTGVRSGACSAVLNGAIYMIAGYDGVHRLSSVECFRDGRWQAVPAMSVARNQPCATVADGAIYVMAGFSNGTAVSSVECFRDGRWEMAPPISTARFGACVVSA